MVPDPLDMPLEMADAAAVAKELRTLLRRALPRPGSPLPYAQCPPALSEKAKVQLASMGVRLGDCVVIAGQKVCYSSPLGVSLFKPLALECVKRELYLCYPSPPSVGRKGGNRSLL